MVKICIVPENIKNGDKPVTLRLAVILVAFIAFSGCAKTIELAPPDAHLIIGLRVTPEYRKASRGLFSVKSNAAVELQRHPRRRNIPLRVARVNADQGWVYRVFPVVSGLYAIRSVHIRGGGIRGEEVTRLSRTSRESDGRVSVNAAYIFDVPEGAVAYIGSFDIEASNLPVEIELTQDVLKAKEAAEKAGLDLSSFQVLERNMIRGMEKLMPTKDAAS